ncbi:MAG: fructose-6-phosphate aldolase [Ruminococcaceae bacterium]|nr:fructose-6-phosphate aldolase [Oscillospiraceae bacterium]
MMYIIDSANLEKIRECVEFYPVAGVTTNPTIISREKTDFITLIKSIREIIGPDRMFHIQTTALDAENIVKEAVALQETVGGDFYIKIPICPEGLKATMALKKMGIKVTETAIFTQQQAMLAAIAGADFVAPYVNRLDNIVSDGVHVVGEIVEMFKQHNISSKVLAASFKTVEQVHKIAMVGGHAVTINTDLFQTLTYHPLTQYAIDDFIVDWESCYGKVDIMSLINKDK